MAKLDFQVSNPSTYFLFNIFFFAKYNKGGRKNCCKEKLTGRYLVMYVYRLRRAFIINTEGGMRIFLMTTVGVVGTTRGSERVKHQKFPQ